MNVVDKIVTEWAFRCKKGYPDTKNPDDMKILKEIYSEFGIVLEEEEASEEEVKENDVKFEELQALLATRKGELNQDQINKLAKILGKTGKGYTAELLQRFANKKLGDQQSRILVGYADQNHFEDKLLASIDNKQNTFANLPNSGNIVTELVRVSQVGKKYVKALVDFTTGQGTKGVGRGELALISILHDTESADVGDVKTASGTLEVKYASAILASSKHITRGLDAKAIRQKIVNVLEVPEQDQAVITGKQSGEWIDRLLRYTQDISQIQKVVDAFYGSAVKLSTSTQATAQAIKTAIAKQLAKDYMDSHKGQKLMIIASNYNYAVYETADLLEAAIGSDIIVTAFSDLTPRLTFKGEVSKN